MKKRYRVALMLESQGIKSGNFGTKDEADNFILQYMEKGNVMKYRILDRKENKIIEDERGMRK